MYHNKIKKVYQFMLWKLLIDFLKMKRINSSVSYFCVPEQISASKIQIISLTTNIFSIIFIYNSNLN